MKYFLKFLYLLIRTGKPGKARFFARWHGSGNLDLLQQVQLLPGRRIQYIPSGAIFTNHTWPLFGQSLSLLQQSASLYDATEVDCKLWLSTNLHDQYIIACMANTESLMCMYEVFGLHVYQVLGVGPCLAIDVGMNIGLASLYLAAIPEVKAVYGYELVGATTKFALTNIAANSYAAAKVLVRHAGVAGESGQLQLPITGVGDVGAHVNMLQENANTETVHLISLTTIVQQIGREHPGLPIVLKLDCEGSEYDIVPQLQAEELHKYIHVLMIEWHIRGSKPITEILTACGYICFTSGIVAAQPTGFVYAVKQHLFTTS